MAKDKDKNGEKAQEAPRVDETADTVPNEPVAAAAAPTSAEPVADTTPMPEVQPSYAASVVPEGAPSVTDDHRMLIGLVAGFLGALLLLGMLFGAGALARRAFAGRGFQGRAQMMQRYGQQGYGYGRGYGRGGMMRGWADQNGPQRGYGYGRGYCPGQRGLNQTVTPVPVPQAPGSTQ